MSRCCGSLKRLGLGLIAVAMFVGPAAAADLKGSTKDSPADYSIAEPTQPWTFSFTTYAWLTWLSGDLTVRGRPLSVDASPIDVIDALDWSGIPAWMSSFEARSGRLGLFGDIVYAQLSDSASFARSGQSGPVTTSLSGRIQVDYKQAILEFGAAYEVWGDQRSPEGGRMAFDVLAGGRYWYQKTSVSADLAATLAGGGLIGGLDIEGGRVIARSGSVDWLDPFIGMRMRYQIDSGQKLMVRGDIGGFGAGSDFSWQALGTYEFRMMQRTGYVIDGYLGYRALSVDYSKGSGNSEYRYDVIQHGPVLGATVRF
jgi:hypothetical protein